jgi:hypothetical protein
MQQVEASVRHDQHLTRTAQTPALVRQGTQGKKFGVLRQHRKNKRERGGSIRLSRDRLRKSRQRIAAHHFPPGWASFAADQRRPDPRVQSGFDIAGFVSPRPRLRTIDPPPGHGLMDESWIRFPIDDRLAWTLRRDAAIGEY